MSSIFTRRNALFVFGTGAGAALLSACGGNSTAESSGSGSASSSDASPSASSSSSSSSSSSASASSSSASASSSSESSSSQSGATDIDMSGSYGGKINFESVLEYEKSGTYEPATKEHPAKNVPKPKKPAGADEKSLKGLHLSIAFAVAATQYAYNTGDYSLLEQSSMSEPERNYFLREEKERLDKPAKAHSGRIILRSSIRSPKRVPGLKAMANTYGIVNLSLGTVNSRLLTAKLSTIQTKTTT